MTQMQKDCTELTTAVRTQTIVCAPLPHHQLRKAYYTGLLLELTTDVFG